MDRPDLAQSPDFTRFDDRARNYWNLKPQLEAAFSGRSCGEWEELLSRADVPFAQMLTVEEVLSHPQSRSLDLLAPPADGQSLVRPPWRFGGLRPARPVPAPEIGVQIRTVLQAFLPAIASSLCCNRV